MSSIEVIICVLVGLVALQIGFILAYIISEHKYEKREIKLLREYTRISHLALEEQSKYYIEVIQCITDDLESI